MLSLPLACGPGPDYAETRRACGLEDGEYVALSHGESDSYRVISAACAQRLGNDLHLDWLTFGEEPTEIANPGTTAERVIAGAYSLISADMGTVGGLMRDEGLPATLREGLAEGHANVADDSPAGALWWWFITQRIDRLRSAYADEIEPDLWMSYLYGTVTVQPLDSGSTRGQSLPILPMEVAATLVHEAGHATSPVHVACSRRGDFCDATPEGSHGMALYWVHSWTVHNREEIASADLSVADGFRATYCQSILDHDGFVPCTTE